MMLALTHETSPEISDPHSVKNILSCWGFPELLTREKNRCSFSRVKLRKNQELKGTSSPQRLGRAGSDTYEPWRPLGCSTAIFHLGIRQFPFILANRNWNRPCLSRGTGQLRAAAPHLLPLSRFSHLFTKERASSCSISGSVVESPAPPCTIVQEHRPPYYSQCMLRHSAHQKTRGMAYSQTAGLLLA